MNRNAPPEADSDTWFISVLWGEFITLAEQLLLMYNELSIFLSEQELSFHLGICFCFHLYQHHFREREGDKFAPL